MLYIVSLNYITCCIVRRQRIRWRDIVERDLRVLNLREEEAQDIIYWRQRTRAADPTRG